MLGNNVRLKGWRRKKFRRHFLCDRKVRPIEQKRFVRKLVKNNLFYRNLQELSVEDKVISAI